MPASEVSATAKLVQEATETVADATGLRVKKLRGWIVVTIILMLIAFAHWHHWQATKQVETKIDKAVADIDKAVVRIEAAQAATNREVLAIWKALALGEIKPLEGLEAPSVAESTTAPGD